MNEYLGAVTILPIIYSDSMKPFTLLIAILLICRINATSQKSLCDNLNVGTISFMKKSTKLDKNGIAILRVLAKDMRANPACTVVIAGVGNMGKMEQQYSWDRAYECIQFMVEREGIDRERFIFSYGQDGLPDHVDFRGAQDDEKGPDSVPPPFPNLRRR